MRILHMVYDYDGYAAMSPTLHATRRDTLLEALRRFGEDMEEMHFLLDDQLENALYMRIAETDEDTVLVFSGTREYFAKFFDEFGILIPLELDAMIEGGYFAP